MFTSWEGLKMVKRVYKRYSEAFRLHVVKEYEEGAGIRQLQKKYGITGTPTIYNWVKKYSKEGLRDRLMIIQKPEERDRVKELEERNKRLEALVTQLSIDKLLLESTLTVIKREYGIDVGDIKKNGPPSLKKPFGKGRKSR
jgi:transposase-like protein